MIAHIVMALAISASAAAASQFTETRISEVRTSCEEVQKGKFGSPQAETCLFGVSDYLSEIGYGATEPFDNVAAKRHRCAVDLIVSSSAETVGEALSAFNNRCL